MVMPVKYLKWILFLLIIVIILSFGFVFQNKDSDTNERKYQVVLYVNSQSNYRVDPVYVKVIIDTNVVVNQNIYFGNGGHNNYKFNLALTEGEHQLVAESSNGNAGIDVVFPIDKKKWLVLSYWGQNHFQLNINDKPVIFN
jgi:hypothetical protein